MKKVYLTLLLLLAVAPSYAQLTPYYQSIQEIKALLDDSRLEQSLGPRQMIQEIIKVEDGYRVKTSETTLHVKVHYQYFEKIGAAEFTLDFEKVKEGE